MKWVDFIYNRLLVILKLYANGGIPMAIVSVNDIDDRWIRLYIIKYSAI